jgi:hypothetical protein
MRVGYRNQTAQVPRQKYLNCEQFCTYSPPQHRVQSMQPHIVRLDPGLHLPSPPQARGPHARVFRASRNQLRFLEVPEYRAVGVRREGAIGVSDNELGARSVYVFRCGESSVYAFTADRTGQILPRIYPRIRWRLQREVTLQPRQPPLPTVRDTGVRPLTPIARAAAGLKSMIRPRTNGPRSLMRTTTARPL